MKLKVVDSFGSLTVVRRPRSPNWVLSSNGPDTIDDLPFVARDSEGRAIWWKVDPPKTNYDAVHRMLGKAYAIDLIDYIHATASCAAKRRREVFSESSHRRCFARILTPAGIRSVKSSGPRSANISRLGP